MRAMAPSSVLVMWPVLALAILLLVPTARSAAVPR